jgi:hypothetical protein
MRDRSHTRLFVYWIVRLVIVALVGVVLSACEASNPRPGPAFDGSAMWGLGIAQPLIADFAPDAEVYSILGMRIYEDGRLPANAGSWGFVAWSPSRQEQFQVTVNYDGSIKTSTRGRTSPPSPNGQPIPAGWVNSTVIFDAMAPHRTAGVTEATLVVFNFTDFLQARGEATWGINFSGGPNHLVKWDGTYLGTQ